MGTNVPAGHAEAVEEQRAERWRLAERARLLARKGDQPGLRALADEVRRRSEAEQAILFTGGHVASRVDDINAALDRVYDEVFPVRDPGDLADVLDAPWPTDR